MDQKSYNDRTCLETRFNGPNGPTISYGSESQSRLEASKFQGRRHDLAQEHAHLGDWSSRTEELHESHDTFSGPCCESIVHETPSTPLSFNEKPSIFRLELLRFLSALLKN